MNVKKVILSHQEELTAEHRRLSNILKDTQEKLLKTEGAILILQHFAKIVEKED